MDLKSIQRKIIGWGLVELALPVCFAVGVWPVSKFVLNLPNSYSQLLSSGDLLIVGALILIGCTFDIYFDFNKIFHKNNVIYTIVLIDGFVALVFLAMYGFIKTKSMQLTVFPQTSDKISLMRLASISLTAVLASCTWAIFSKMK